MNSRRHSRHISGLGSQIGHIRPNLTEPDQSSTKSPPNQYQISTKAVPNQYQITAKSVSDQQHISNSSVPNQYQANASMGRMGRCLWGLMGPTGLMRPIVPRTFRTE